jgi:hypothetical protein
MLGAALLAGFAYFIRRTYAPSRLFMIVFSVGIVGEFLTGLIPDQPLEIDPFSAWSFLHLPAGVVLLFMIPAAMWLFADSKNIHVQIKRDSRLLSKIYLVLLVPELILIHFHVLYAVCEAISLIIFDTWVLYLSSQKMVGEIPDETNEQSVSVV